MRHLVLAQVRAHRGRYVASAVAVLVAVAFVVTTLVLGDTINSSITKSTAAQYEGVSAVVTAGDSGLDADALTAAVSATPGVTDVALDTTGAVRVTGTDGPPAYGTATSIATDGALRWQRLSQGRMPAAGEVAVGSSSSHVVGDVLTLSGADDAATPVTVTVVGIVDLTGSPDALDSGLLFGEVDQVRRWIGGDGDWQLRVLGSDAVDAVAAAVPGVDVVSGPDRATEVADAHIGDVALLRNILLCFAAIAVVVAGLVIANTFAVLLAARTRELALMRCVGVSARQVRRSVGGEALVVGFVSALLGVVAGVAFAAAVVAAARAAAVPLPLTSIAVTPATVIAGLMLGTAVTVCAAGGPARAATRVPALAALHPLETQPEPVTGSWLRRIAAAVTIGGGVVLLGVGVATADVLVACPGGLLVFVGVVLASRRLVPAAVGALGAAVARFGGPVASLAAGNARRNPRRTASTATALFIGVTLTSTIVVGIGTLKAGAPAVIDENFPVDVAVTSSSGEITSSAMERFAEIDGVSAATAITTADISIGGTEFSVLGVDPASAEATIRDEVPFPGPGTIVVELELAETLGVSDGERVTVDGGAGSMASTVRVSERGVDMLDIADLRGIAGAVRPDTVWLRLADGLSDAELVAVTDELSRVAADTVPGADVVGAVAMRQMLGKVLDTMLLIVGGLLSVAVLIALIGVGNTMALSVLERRQETGVLRAVGLSRAGVRNLLIGEAVIIAGVASALGVLLGLVLGAAGTASVVGAAHVGLGAVPWLQLVAIVLAGGAAGVIASVLPARRASRIPPVAALAALT